MADRIGKEPPQLSTGRRRPSTDPVQASVAMDGRPSGDTGSPRAVRFSEEIMDRATPSAVQRPATPILTVDTTSEAMNPKDSARSPTTPSLRIATSPTSPTSPRTRERGYSLRRSLFSKSINKQGGGSPFELVEVSSARENEGIARSVEEGQREPKGMNSQTEVIVSSVPDPELEISLSRQYVGPPEESRAKSKDKTFGTVSLPNYDVWARGRKQHNASLKKIRLYKDMVLNGIIGNKRIPPSKDGRHIDLDAARKIPLIDERTGREYIGNTIRSSRYSLWDFLPRQLLFQFGKLANAYFLLTSILQMIPGLSPLPSYTSFAPLLVFVSISMAKEGYDDIRRWQLDKVENNRETQVLHAYEPVPHISDQSANSSAGRGFRSMMPFQGDPKNSQVAVIDSEISATNSLDDHSLSLPTEGPKHWATLKWKDVKVGDIIKLRRDDDIPADIVLLHADGPNGIAFIETMALDGETNLKTKQAPPHLFERCGTLDNLAACQAHIVAEDPNVDLYSFDGRVTVDGETLPLTTNEVVFRGSTLRNTSNALGIVINTGEECKIRMNANKTPRIKAPAMQTISNRIVIMLVVFVLLLSLFCSIAYQIWAANVERKSWYIQHAHIKFAFIFIGFIILFNTMIPLSLYVSLEIIKVGQLLLMRDPDMYDPVSDTPMVCNTTTILENLGQINYIFSDKTGTLTDNVMRFRKLSVAGYAWLHDFDLQKEALEKLRHSQERVENHERKGKGIAKRFSMTKKARPALRSRNDSEGSTSPVYHSDLVRQASSVSRWKSSARPTKIQPEIRTEELLRFMQLKPHSIFTKKAKIFLLSLALCHTCLPEVQENGEIEFQAASPDELALVRAAQDLKFLVIDRSSRSITLNYPGGPGDSETVTETYDILDVVEFSSKRKRMSIIVRFPNGKICIFCKGADSAILPRLKHASLALQKASEISRRASKRKSMEVEEALRRMSEHSPRTSFSSLPRKSINLSRKSIGHGRPSMASTRLQPIRDELDSWLKQREHDVEMAPNEQDLSAYQPPRTSMARSSFASSESRFSMQGESFDDLIDEALVLDDAVVFERCFQHIDDFASEGLRTLLFGYRFIDEKEYAGWKKIYSDATTSLVDRQKLIESAGEMIEQNFDLAGATAIEDKLQKGVPETIDKLRRANIKIWMLTGDKRETAINIAYSARICKSYSEVVILDHTTGEVEQRMASTLLDITQGSIPHSVIVVDGQTLSEIEANDILAMLFFDLVVVSDSVICCRASPSQKASLVEKIRLQVKGSLTLAIGDGANDIAMIQEAHVGIGISGKEGLQAARISDYSIAQFRFLQKLLLVHGRWNYVRIGKYILVTFWKEFLFYLIQAMYQRWNGYTGSSLFEATSLTVFNTLFTSLPVIFLGIFEQDLAADTLLSVPELYVWGQRNQTFNFKKYFAWMFMAVSETVIIYFCMFVLWGEAYFKKDESVIGLGQMCFTAAVTIINTKALILEMHNKTFITAIGWFVSVGGWFVWTLAMAGGVIPNATKYRLQYPVISNFLDHYGADLLWWMSLILILASVVLFELAVSSLRKALWPTDTDVFQELQKDPIIRRRFEETVKNELEGRGSVEMGREQRTTAELQRESEIQELLNRPRVMDGGAHVAVAVGGDADVATSPIGRVTRRKFSVDVVATSEENIEMVSPRATGMAKSRHSVEIAEVLDRQQ